MVYMSQISPESTSISSKRQGEIRFCHQTQSCLQCSLTSNSGGIRRKVIHCEDLTSLPSSSSQRCTYFIVTIASITIAVVGVSANIALGLSSSFRDHQTDSEIYSVQSPLSTQTRTDKRSILKNSCSFFIGGVTFSQVFMK